MKITKNGHLITLLLITLVLSLPTAGQGQDNAGTDQSKLNAVQVQTGQRMKVEGVILEKVPSGLTLLCPGGIGLQRFHINRYRNKREKDESVPRIEILF